MKIILTPETSSAWNTWQLYFLSTDGGQYMTDEMLRYGLFVPDSALIAATMEINPN